MFGRPSQNNPNQPNPLNKGAAANGATGPVRPAAADVAQLQGGGLVQVIVTSLAPFTYYVFLNDEVLSQIDVESLNVAIEAPNDTNGGGVVRATLSRYVDSVTGGKTTQRTELFPCVLEIVALKRRLSIICPNANNLDGVVVSFGLKPNGESEDANGLHSLQVLLTEGILDARLTWNDGTTETIFPQT